MRYSRVALLLGAASILWSNSALAQDIGLDPVDVAGDDQDSPPISEGVDTLLGLPLEDLLNLESTSVAKKRQKVSDAAAAVFIITQDDIRRSAARTIPDLLRMVPGMEVAEIQNGATAVSARGFNSRFSNSLLVMIDGRAIYVSSLSGVLWDQQLLPLDEIERIEVVRGPGATLWGANAVTGVVNIISKHSIDTQGVLADVRVGTRQQKANIAFGDRIGDRASYRVSGIILRDKGLTDKSGTNLTKAGKKGGLGARFDFEPTNQDAITVQTEYSKSDIYTPFGSAQPNAINPIYEVTETKAGGQNFSVLGRWSRKANENTELTTQIYFDSVSRKEFYALIKRRMADIDVGLRWRANDVHEFSFGVGGRVTWDWIRSSPDFSITRKRRTDQWFNGYVQDDISIIQDKLRLSLGAKIEQNSVSKFEFQPSARIFYKPNKNIAFWGAISRAVRIPSRFEMDSRLRFTEYVPPTPEFPMPITLSATFAGNNHLNTERQISYEMGVRGQFFEGWSFDAAGYYNNYKKLVGMELVSIDPIFQPPFPYPVGLNANLKFKNLAHGRTYGGELAIKGRIRSWWNLNLAYSYLNFKTKVGGNPLSRPLIGEEGSPKNQISLRQFFDIGSSVSINPQLRYVGHVFDKIVSDYFDFDVRASYHITPVAELSLAGTGLFKKRRLESALPSYPAPLAYVPRTVSAQLRIRF